MRGNSAQGEEKKKESNDGKRKSCEKEEKMSGRQVQESTWRQKKSEVK